MSLNAFALLAKQINFLSQERNVISLEELILTLQEGRTPDKGTTVITFDDGNVSDFSLATPILKKYDFTATFFVTVGWVGNLGYLSWDQIAEMNCLGMSIQSHTMTHPFLTNLDNTNLQKELSDSKAILEEKLAKSVDFVSIPSGFVNGRVKKMAKNAGYKGICVSLPGLNRLENTNSNDLYRMMVTRKTTFERFCRMADGDEKLVGGMRSQYRIKSGVRKLIGNKFYYKLWSMRSKEI